MCAFFFFFFFWLGGLGHTEPGTGIGRLVAVPDSPLAVSLRLLTQSQSQSQAGGPVPVGGLGRRPGGPSREEKE